MGSVKRDIRLKEVEIGMKFGQLTLIEKYTKKGTKQKYTYFKCKCDCGNLSESLWLNIRSGATKSCGCLVKKNGNNWRLEPGISVFNSIFSNYKGNAKRRNIEFNLTKKQFEEIINQNCNYCGDPPKEGWSRFNNGNYIYNGVDRIDNTKGYILENCAPCCKFCNTMKLDKTIDEFLKQVKKIYKKNINE